MNRSKDGQENDESELGASILATAYNSKVRFKGYPHTRHTHTYTQRDIYKEGRPTEES